MLPPSAPLLELVAPPLAPLLELDVEELFAPPAPPTWPPEPVTSGMPGVMFRI
jgi:hypothetical protein